MKKRIHILYDGRVQGVGFRFTTERVALTLNLKGWVKNLPDGRVEIVLEGEETNLILFIGKMKNGPMGPYIHDAEITWQTTTGEFEDFRITF